MGYIVNGYKYVGGTPSNHGIKYDDLDLLFNDYYKLLVKCLLVDGFEFNVDGILGRIKLENEGFALYTKPNTVFDDHSDFIQKRLVSADFVLLMFDRQCISNFYEEIRSKKHENIAFSYDVNLLYPKFVTREYLVAGKAAIMNGDSTINNGVLINLYTLLGKIQTYKKPFKDHYKKVDRVKQLTSDLNSKKRNWDSFSDEEADLLDDSNMYSGEYDDCPEFYLSLGCFSNFIRQEALNNIYRMKKSPNLPNDLTPEESILYSQGDPVIFNEYFEPMRWNEELLYAELDNETNWHFSLKEGIQLVGNNPSISHDGMGDDFAMPADGGRRHGRGGFVS